MVSLAGNRRNRIILRPESEYRVVEGKDLKFENWSVGAVFTEDQKKERTGRKGNFLYIHP